VEAEGLAEIAVEQAVPVIRVLDMKRQIKAVQVTEGIDVGGSGAFAEHLSDGVAGDEMDEKKDDGDDDPENGKGQQDATERLPENERCPGADA
jgi:hypothetical protein